MMELGKNKNLAAIESDFSRQNPEVKFIINRKKAQDLGVSIQSINETVQTLFSGKTVTKFNQMGKEYPIILQAGIENRKKSENLTKIFVRSNTTDKLISLANLVEFEEVGSAKILARYDRQRAVTISARLVGDYTLSEALGYLEKTVIEIYPKVEKIIDYIKSQKGCYFSRITGSGSACIGIFSNMKNTLYAQKLIKLKYPKYWSAVSKTI